MARPPEAESALPHNLDAERAVLGAALLDPRVFLALQDKIKADDFYSPSHRVIFECLMALTDERRALDLTTLAEALRLRGELEAIGGPAYLASLEEYVFTTEHAPQYADTIRDLSRRRSLIAAAEEIRESAHSSPRSAREVLEESEKRIFDLTQEAGSRDILHVSDAADAAMKQLEARFHNRQDVSGLRTGFARLDELLTGMHRSDLIVVAARPSMGKTAFALNIASFVARRLSAPVGFFSLEMSNEQVVQRILCGMARVSMQKIRRGVVSRAELERLDEGARELSLAPLWLDDTPGATVLELRAMARRLKNRVPDLSLLVVDYLQLMRGHGRSESRQQEVAEITRSLKALARELDLPLIAISQLSRGIEQRKGKDKQPKLSDLRESGAIEQDADVVLFVHRERTATETGENGEGAGSGPLVEAAEVIIGKQRNGPIGSVPMLFIGDYTLFGEVDRNAGF